MTTNAAARIFEPELAANRVRRLFHHTVYAMHLICANCHLRALEYTDAEGLARHANDRGVWLNLRDRFPHPYSASDVQAYIAQLAGQQPQTTFGIIIDGRR